MIGRWQIYNKYNKEQNKSRLCICKQSAYPELSKDLILTYNHSILVDKLTDIQRTRIKELTKCVYLTELKYRLPACIDKRAEPYTVE